MPRTAFLMIADVEFQAEEARQLACCLRIAADDLTSGGTVVLNDDRGEPALNGVPLTAADCRAIADRVTALLAELDTVTD